MQTYLRRAQIFALGGVETFKIMMRYYTIEMILFRNSYTIKVLLSKAFK